MEITAGYLECGLGVIRHPQIPSFVSVSASVVSLQISDFLVKLENLYRKWRHQFKLISRCLFESVLEFRRAIIIPSFKIVRFVLVEKLLNSGS
jgi:hypothetical protein